MSVEHLRRSVSALAVLAALCGGLAACGSSDSSAGAAASSSPTPSEAAACADVATLETSLASLKDVNLQQDGVDGLTSAIQQVKTDLDAAASSVSSALQPQVQAVSAAFDALQSATSGLSASTLRSQAPAISAALQQVATATSDLASSASQSCPAS